MKKFLAVALGAVMAMSVAALTACGNGPEESYVIEGNYEEIKEDKQQIAISAIDLNSAFGENTETGIAYGFGFSSGFEGGFEIEDRFSFSFGAGCEYTITANLAETLELAGSGKAEVKYSAATTPMIGEPKTEEGSYSLKAYNDSQSVYLDLTSSGEKSDKIKINVASLLEGVSELPDISLPDVGGLPEAGGKSDLNDILTVFSDLGFEVYVDIENGLKIKISATTEVIADLIAGAISSLGGKLPEELVPLISSVASSIKYTNFKYDLYFAFDTNGKFVEYSEDVDVVLTVDASAISMPGVGKISASFKGGTRLKAYKGSVNLPSDLAEDESFTDYTDYIKDMIDESGNIYGKLL